MRFQKMILAYFLLGAVMWGGGVIDWDQIGVGQEFVEQSGADVEVNEDTAGELENVDSPIREAASAVGGGGLLAVLGIILKFFGYLFWPITVLVSVNAPNEVVVLLGGGPTVAFFGAVLRLIRRSA